MQREHLKVLPIDDDTTSNIQSEYKFSGDYYKPDLKRSMYFDFFLF